MVMFWHLCHEFCIFGTCAWYGTCVVLVCEYFAGIEIFVHFWRQNIARLRWACKLGSIDWQDRGRSPLFGACHRSRESGVRRDLGGLSKKRDIFWEFFPTWRGGGRPNLSEYGRTRGELTPYAGFRERHCWGEVTSRLINSFNQRMILVPRYQALSFIFNSCNAAFLCNCPLPFNKCFISVKSDFWPFYWFGIF